MLPDSCHLVIFLIGWIIVYSFLFPILVMGFSWFAVLDRMDSFLALLSSFFLSFILSNALIMETVSVTLCAQEPCMSSVVLP